MGFTYYFYVNIGVKVTEYSRSYVFINALKSKKMAHKNLSIRILEYDSVEQLNVGERALVDISRVMTEKAYAPYSNFFVGAAVLLENGEIVTGSNQENGAYPSGLCAERVAVFAASARFPGVPMNMIAISAKSTCLSIDEPVSPCGACRQVMLEYEVLQTNPIKLLLSKESGKILVVEKVQDLLPLAFTGKDLKKTAQR